MGSQPFLETLTLEVNMMGAFLFVFHCGENTHKIKFFILAILSVTIQ